MRVLVTGANGFIGKRLVNQLKEQGIEVETFTRKDGDISVQGCLDKYENIEHIFHLAAKTFVPDSWDNAYEYYQTNVMGTVSVLEYCKEHKCSMTFLSTYVYGEPQYLPVDEKHPIVPATPYHEGKVLCEKLCKFYSEKHDVKSTVFRPFNVYGKGQSEAFLMPKIYKQVMDESVKEITLMDLKPKRDYVYVDDLIQVMIASIHAPKKFEIYNVGSGVSTSVEDVIKMFLQVTGIEKQYKATGEVRRTEISDCVADLSKLRADFPEFKVTQLAKGMKLWHEESDK